MSFSNMTGTLFKVAPDLSGDPVKLIDVLEQHNIYASSSIFELGESEPLGPDTPVDPEKNYFVLDRPTEVSRMLQRVLGVITLDDLLTKACCIRFRSRGAFTTKEVLRSIVIELRSLGVDAFIGNAPRDLNVREQFTPYQWDCCEDCDTRGECYNDDYDRTPYEDTMEDRLDKERPYRACKNQMWILTFPPSDATFAEQCKIAWGIIPHRENKPKSMRVRQNNKFQIEITNSIGEKIRTVCDSNSTDAKRIDMSFVGHRNLVSITREIIGASKIAIDPGHPHYDSIMRQFDQMASRVYD